MSLSTIIITKNCASTISLCLKSIQSISDEIIILDSGSTDNTVEICLKYTQKVTQTQDWPGFGLQKQRALDQAMGPWILSIDSDEILTPECQNAILTTIKHPRYEAYRIKRLMIFAGKPVTHSGCSDQPVRLFRKDSAHFNDKIVHEAVEVQGKIGQIKEVMLHYSYANINDWIEKMNRYSSLGAQQKGGSKKYSVTYAILAASISFIKMFFLKKGFLDGRLGLVAAINAAVACYYKYLKLALDKHFKILEEVPYVHMD